MNLAAQRRHVGRLMGMDMLGLAHHHTEYAVVSPLVCKIESDENKIEICSLLITRISCQTPLLRTLNIRDSFNCGVFPPNFDWLILSCKRRDELLAR